MLTLSYFSVVLNSFIILLLGNTHLSDFSCFFSYCVLVIEVYLVLDFIFLLLC